MKSATLGTPTRKSGELCDQQQGSLSNYKLTCCNSNVDLSSSKSPTGPQIAQTRSSSFHQRAKKFLNLSTGPLKPSASTSCLMSVLNQEQNTNQQRNISATASSTTLANNPSRASLTHEWKKLKTPNKCRECNMLVYFNGRECAYCGFVAHKKCISVLVINCSRQSEFEQLGGTIKNKSKSLLSSDKNLSNISGSSDQKSKTLDSQSCSSGNQRDPAMVKSFKVKPTFQPIFGQPINVGSQQALDFVKRFIYEIDTRGLNYKGIYRVSSIKSKVDRLCNYYDQNISSLVDLSSFHPNIIANALKMYFRQLPEPLLTFGLYERFIDIAKRNAVQKLDSNDSDDRFGNIEAAKSSTIRSETFAESTRNISYIYNPILIIEIKQVLDLLPKINRELVAILMCHLKRVAEMSKDNQMSAINLSIIFGPTLLNANNKTLALVDNVHQARLIELMITWADHIFPIHAEMTRKLIQSHSINQNTIKDITSLDDRAETSSHQTRKLRRPSQTGSQSEQYKHRSEPLWTASDPDQSNLKLELMRQNKSSCNQDVLELRRQFFEREEPDKCRSISSCMDDKNKTGNNKNLKKNSKGIEVPKILIQTQVADNNS